MKLLLLITLNVFLASAVFIGLSLAAPDDVKNVMQTAYCDLTQQLAQVTANITSSSFSGVATLLGLVFLLASLITMGEVQYGPWQGWYGCNIPWLSHLAVCFIGFEVCCALIGTAGFFNGWKVL